MVEATGTPRIVVKQHISNSQNERVLLCNTLIFVNCGHRGVFLDKLCIGNTRVISVMDERGKDTSKLR